MRRDRTKTLVAFLSWQGLLLASCGEAADGVEQPSGDEVPGEEPVDEVLGDPSSDEEKGSETSGTGDSGGDVTLLGEECDELAAFSCDGNNPQVALVCDGDGEWTIHATCAAEERCSLAPGTLGSCVAPEPACESGPGTRYCDGTSVWECSGEGFPGSLIEDCDVACDSGQCVAMEGCVGLGVDQISCDARCGTPNERCYSGDEQDCLEGVYFTQDPLGEISSVELPSAARFCPGDPIAVFTVILPAPVGMYYRLSVDEGWQFLSGRIDEHDGSQCIVVSESQHYQVDGQFYLMSTGLPESPLLNIEVVPVGTRCP